MRNFLLGLGVAAVAAIALAADRPQPGPAQTDEEEVRGKLFKMYAKSSRDSAGSVFNYHLDLQHDKLYLYESENREGRSALVYLGKDQTIGLEVRKDPKGVPKTVAVWMKNKCGYIDLNCDGMWDGMSDSREDGNWKRLISLNGQWFRVMNHLGGFGLGPERDFQDRTTEYYWDGKAWGIKPPK